MPGPKPPSAPVTDINRPTPGKRRGLLPPGTPQAERPEVRSQPAVDIPDTPEAALDAIDDADQPGTAFFVCDGDSKGPANVRLLAQDANGQLFEWSLIALSEDQAIDGWRPLDAPPCKSPTQISAEAALAIGRARAQREGFATREGHSHDEAMHHFDELFQRLPLNTQPAGTQPPPSGPFDGNFQQAFLAVSADDLREHFDLESAPPPTPERSQRIVRDAWRAAVGDDTPELQPVVQPADAQRIVSEAQGVDIDALRELLRQIEALLDKAGPSEIERNASALQHKVRRLLDEAFGDTRAVTAAASSFGNTYVRTVGSRGGGPSQRTLQRARSEGYFVLGLAVAARLHATTVVHEAARQLVASDA